MKFRQVHLDFHTSEHIPNVGAKFDKKQFQEALKIGHVSSITVFSKCHHGWAYHKSQANETHPTLGDFELLTAQIEAAHEIGVKAPIYISAGLDEKMTRRHPDWLVRRKDESTFWAPSLAQAGYHKFCMNSPYLDYLLAQTKEVCEKYKDIGIDGLFFDIVGVQPCYCQNCIRTLISEGKDPYDDKNIIELAERVHANYTKRIREIVDEIDPSIHVFHNGGHIHKGRRDLAFMNTHLELESLPTGGWGYDHFPQSAKYVQQLGLEYLGMTGKFHTAWGEFGGFKHPNALRYECSLSAAFGAKCSIGDQLHPSGIMDMGTYKLIGAGYAELEEKEPWLDGVKAVSDVGIFSYESYCSHIKETLGGTSNEVDKGATRIMLEGKYQFDIIDMESDFSLYKVIILPDAVRITPEMKEKLDEFTKKGGKILASGMSGLHTDRDEFAYNLGGKFAGKSDCKPNYLRPQFEYDTVEPSAYVIYNQGYKVELSDGKTFAKAENSYFNRTVLHFSSHKHTPNSFEYCGEGLILGKDGAYIAWDIFAEYATMGSLIAKRLVCFALDTLLGDNKTVKTDLGAQGIATVMDQTEENRYVAHLLYASPVVRGKDTQIIEDIIPVYDVSLDLKLEKEVKNAYLAPQMTPVDFTRENGRIKLTVEKLDCHQMIVLDY